MIKKQDLPYCPVATTLQIIGSKWKLWILQELQLNSCRFSELQKALPGVSKHVLNSTLKSMLEDGIIIRTVMNQSPVCVMYGLSELGISLQPVLDAMKEWGMAYKKECRE